MYNIKIENDKYIFLYDKPYIYFKNKNREEGAEYAYYLIFNGERIDVRWYTKINEYKYDINYRNGLYKIVSFIRKNGKKESFSSGYLFLHESLIDWAKLTQEQRMQVLNFKHTGLFMLRGNYDYSIQFQMSQQKRLFVLLPSRSMPTPGKIPAFYRWKWGLEDNIFPGNVLCISDPMRLIHDDMAISWLVGHARHDMARELAAIINDIAMAMAIPANEIYFYGSSQGGFVAINLAGILKGTTAVAINFQTSCLKYYQKDVNIFIKNCFPGMTKDQILKNFKERVDLKYKVQSFGQSRLILVQNDQDIHHYEIHFKPFWEKICFGKLINSDNGRYICGNHTAWIYSDNAGHVPESKMMASEIINYVINRSSP